MPQLFSPAESPVGWPVVPVCTSEDCFVLGCVMIAAGAGQPRYCHWADSGDRHGFSAGADSTYQYQYYLVVHLCTQQKKQESL